MYVVSSLLASIVCKHVLVSQPLTLCYEFGGDTDPLSVRSGGFPSPSAGLPREGRQERSVNLAVSSVLACFSRVSSLHS